MVHNAFGIGSEYNYEQFHCLYFDFGLVNFKICLKILSVWPRFVQSHCKGVQRFLTVRMVYNRTCII